MIAADLLRDIGAERRAARSKYCSGARHLGRWLLHRIAL